MGMRLFKLLLRKVAFRKERRNTLIISVYSKNTKHVAKA